MPQRSSRRRVRRGNSRTPASPPASPSRAIRSRNRVAARRAWSSSGPRVASSSAKREAPDPSRALGAARQQPPQGLDVDVVDGGPEAERSLVGPGRDRPERGRGQPAGPDQGRPGLQPDPGRAHGDLLVGQEGHGQQGAQGPGEQRQGPGGDPGGEGGQGGAGGPARDQAGTASASRPRYGAQPGSMRPTAITIQSVSLGARGSRRRRKPASWRRRSSFWLLQRRQAATTFSHTWRPPRERGTTWSTFSARSPQYWQV